MAVVVVELLVFYMHRLFTIKLIHFLNIQLWLVRVTVKCRRTRYYD